LTSVNVRYLVENDCIRQGGGYSVNSGIKVVNELRQKESLWNKQEAVQNAECLQIN
jgi:hypothetical protein